MERTIEIPNGVNAEVDGFKVKITGTKGTLERNFYSSLFKKEITIQKNDNKIVVSTKSKRKKTRAMIGTIESHVKNMFDGVQEGYSAKLKIVYMHFPFTVKISGKELLINNFLGEKTPRRARILGDCKVELQGEDIVVTGISKEDVGQTAAQLERATRIKQRDRRVFQDGLFITKKP